MTTKRKPRGLGLGLEALLGPAATEEEQSADVAAQRSVPLDLLQPGRYQPRTRMDEGALQQLAESIRAQGVMQPILVRPIDAQRYEIIAGERRFRAARLAGMEQVPVLVRDVPDEAAAVMALIENIQRENLNPLEEAQGLKRLTEQFGLTHEQAAQSVGRSRSAASNLLRLLQLAAPVQDLLMAGEIDMGHARALLGVPAAQQIVLASEVTARRLSVRETEKRVQKALSSAVDPAATRSRAAPKSGDLMRLQELLSDKLAAVVSIRTLRTGAGGPAGEVVIRFDSLDALDGLLERIGIEER